MAHPPPAPAIWRSIRGLPGKTPLRAKLIAAVLALVTIALLVISIAGIAFLRGYLLNQADQELKGYVLTANPTGQVSDYLATGQTRLGYGPLSIQWLPVTGGVHQALAELLAVHHGRPLLAPAPAVQRSDRWLIHTGRADLSLPSWLNTSGYPVSAPVTVGASSGGRQWRVVSTAASVPVGLSGPAVKGTIVVGLDVTSIYRTLRELTVIDVIISSALLLVLAVVGVALIGSSMRPLRDIERTAEAIAAGNLGRRVPERDPRTEVGRLGRSLNAMLAHIEAAFSARLASEEAARRSEEAARRSARDASRSEDRMRQFVADASHELRTPLTAIRGFAEYYRQRGGVAGAPPGDAESADARPAAGPRGEAQAEEPVGVPVGQLTSADVDRLIKRVEAEARRMGVLVDDMLLLARLDQQRSLDFRTVDLLAIAADALHDARVIAPDRAINLTVETSDVPLVTGDEVGLRQVVSNLMSNAMTHTPDGTPIDITIKSGTMGNGQRPAPAGAAVPGDESPTGPNGEPAVILKVADQGPGLTDEQKERVFERFYRTDRARSRTAGGTGLGLAIVAAMISAHNGRVWVDSRPGKGATFGFALPLAPEARSDVG
jgi:two-component system, OmpR family, sensor kinase